jgi:hypothetical protein
MDKSNLLKINHVEYEAISFGDAQYFHDAAIPVFAQQRTRGLPLLIRAILPDGRVIIDQGGFKIKPTRFYIYARKGAA